MEAFETPVQGDALVSEVLSTMAAHGGSVDPILIAGLMRLQGRAKLDMGKFNEARACFERCVAE
ncbi:MAG TPA: hypothetical protein VGJ84_13910, partial [Polyangiaceae bacterium]